MLINSAQTERKSLSFWWFVLVSKESHTILQAFFHNCYKFNVSSGVFKITFITFSWRYCAHPAWKKDGKTWNFSNLERHLVFICVFGVKVENPDHGKRHRYLWTTLHSPGPHPTSRVFLQYLTQIYLFIGVSWNLMFSARLSRNKLAFKTHFKNQSLVFKTFQQQRLTQFSPFLAGELDFALRL